MKEGQSEGSFPELSEVGEFEAIPDVDLWLIADFESVLLHH